MLEIDLIAKGFKAIGSAPRLAVFLELVKAGNTGLSVGEIQEQLERLIEEVEGDEMTTIEISEALYKLKNDIEEHIIKQEEGGDLQWEDLD